jgi:ribosomal protein S18 acetylase RimI-like enzyme
VARASSSAEDEAAGPGDSFYVRPLSLLDTQASARLHHEVLRTEFLARAGERFLRRYHLAWCESPAGLALAAASADGKLAGVLLGTLGPAAHYRFMARRHGVDLALCLLAQAAAHPRFARELFATRGFRYARGALRVLARRGGTARGTEPARKEGEITHLMVAPAARGAGVGRKLLEEALRAAEAAGLDQVVLVTRPELASAGFYSHLGWQPYGEVTSRSGEHFVRYRWPLGS